MSPPRAPQPFERAGVGRKEAAALASAAPQSAVSQGYIEPAIWAGLVLSLCCLKLLLWWCYFVLPVVEVCPATGTVAHVSRTQLGVGVVSCLCACQVGAFVWLGGRCFVPNFCFAVRLVPGLGRVVSVCRYAALRPAVSKAKAKAKDPGESDNRCVHREPGSKAFAWHSFAPLRCHLELV